MSLLKRWCEVHDPCDLEAAHGLLKLAGIRTDEVHLGGNVYGLEVRRGEQYGLVTRNGEVGYEVGWYIDEEEIGQHSVEELGPLDGQTMSEVVAFLRARIAHGTSSDGVRLFDE